jgi:hypothetical protein
MLAVVTNVLEQLERQERNDAQNVAPQPAEKAETIVPQEERLALLKKFNELEHRGTTNDFSSPNFFPKFRQLLQHSIFPARGKFLVEKYYFGNILSGLETIKHSADAAGELLVGRDLFRNEAVLVLCRFSRAPSMFLNQQTSNLNFLSYMQLFKHAWRPTLAPSLWR